MQENGGLDIQEVKMANNNVRRRNKRIKGNKVFCRVENKWLFSNKLARTGQPPKVCPNCKNPNF